MIDIERLQGAASSEETSTLLHQLEEALSALHQKDARCQELSLQVRTLRLIWCFISFRSMTYVFL